MKNEKLTQDEYDALAEVARGIKGDRVSACVGRNTKRLAGLKLFSVAKNGRLSLTWFHKRCYPALNFKMIISQVNSVHNEIIHVSF